jgi:WD40 repeat protein
MISPNGKRIFSCGMDKTMKVWDMATGHETLTLKGSSLCLAGTRDGKRVLVSGRLPGTCRLLAADMKMPR